MILDPDDILRESHTKSLYEQVHGNEFYLIIIAQLHADGESKEVNLRSLKRQLLQFVYEKVCIQLIDLEKGRSFVSIDREVNINVRLVLFSEKKF